MGLQGLRAKALTPWGRASLLAAPGAAPRAGELSPWQLAVLRVAGMARRPNRLKGRQEARQGGETDGRKTVGQMVEQARGSRGW